MKELIENNAVLLVTVAALALSGIRGYRKGFLRMITSAASMIISIFVSRIFAPKLALRMAENNAWVSFVQAEVLPVLKTVTMEQVFLALGFLILFVVVSVLLLVLAGTLERMTEGTVLEPVNRVLGILPGAALALTYIWAVMLFTDIMPQLPLCREVSAQIAADRFLSVIHENNLLTGLLQNVLK